MKKYISCFLFLLCLQNVSSVGVVIKGDKYLRRLIEWTREKGARFNQKVEFRSTNPDDPDAPFGLFALQEIRGKEIIFSIPNKLVLTTGKKEVIKSAMPCETVFRLIREMKRGKKSKFAPWMNYLKKQKKISLPSSWSKEGKDLLKLVVDQLRPAGVDNWIEQEWYQECKGEKNEIHENLALMVVSRGWDYIMVPVYEIMNHRNGNYYNSQTIMLNDGEKDVIQVRARRRIGVGEQIYTSYNLCDECNNRKEDYGTPEILRDYGFVEEYPQRWVFDEILKFEIVDGSTIDIDEQNVHRLEPAPNDKLYVNWIGKGQLEDEDKVFLTEEIERLQKLADNQLKEPNEAVPKEELTVILDYHKALLQALTLALENFPVYKNKDSTTDTKDEASTAKDEL